MWTESKVDRMANDKNERSQRKDNLRREKSDWNGLRVLNEGSSMHCNEGVVSHFMRSWFGFRLDMAPCISIKVDFAAYFSSARRIKVDILQS